MVLQFLCPNGHKVHCSEERAGQAAKCPRCGVKFRIPTIEEIHSTGTPDVTTGSSVKVESGSGSGAPASGIALGAATGADQIEFLCPNDHLLHGPARLQGRPGECPECGSKFRIPTYVDQAEASGPAGGSGAHASDPVSFDVAAAVGQQAQAGSKTGADSEGPAKESFPGGLPGIDHPAAKLVMRLWAYKSHGATIELRYGEGHRLTPDQFVHALATPSHGVFAVTEPNGTLTLTAVAWDAIHVVIARGVRGVPEEDAS
jgi:hypothetical protein